MLDVQSNAKPSLPSWYLLVDELLDDDTLMMNHDELTLFDHSEFGDLYHLSLELSKAQPYVYLQPLH